MDLSPALLWSMVVTISGSTISLVIASITYGRKSKAQSDSIDTSELVAKVVLGDIKETGDYRKRVGLLGRVEQLENGREADLKAGVFVRTLMTEMHVVRDSGEHDMQNAIREALGKDPQTPPTGRIPTARQVLIGDQMRRMTNGDRSSGSGLGGLGGSSGEPFERDRFGTPIPPAPEKPAYMPAIPRSAATPPPLTTKREGYGRDGRDGRNRRDERDERGHERDPNDLTAPPPPHPVQRSPKPTTPFPTQHSGEKEVDSDKKKP